MAIRFRFSVREIRLLSNMADTLRTSWSSDFAVRVLEHRRGDRTGSMRVPEPLVEPLRGSGMKINVVFGPGWTGAAPW
jgi:hypothetical protein